MYSILLLDLIALKHFLASYILSINTLSGLLHFDTILKPRYLKASTYFNTIP